MRLNSIAYGVIGTALATLVAAACGSGETADTSGGTSVGSGVITGGGGAGVGNTTVGSGVSNGGSSKTAAGGSANSSAGGSTSQGGASGSAGASNGGGGSQSTGSGDACGGTCTNGATCGTANGIPVCRTPTGIPVFSHIFVVMMENLSLSALNGDISSAPNIAGFQTTYASGTDYHGATHPSLPNYIALTSGDYWGISCDCKPDPTAGSCNALTCSTLVSDCGCNQAVDNIADQLEAVGKTWHALGEDMGVATPCNTVTAGSYAARHVPFLYYDSIRNDANRCNQNVIDFSALDLSASAPDLQFIAPNLTDDMHDPLLSINGHVDNIQNGDMFIGPLVDKITSSDAYTSGGLLVIVWDEDDYSGEFAADDPIPIFIISPYAKSGGFMSSVKANHYSLLATMEDSFGVPRLANAMSAQPLTDYFPDN